MQAHSLKQTLMVFWLVDNHSYTACKKSSFIASAFSFLMVISGCMNNDLVSGAIATGFTNNLTSLQDALSNLERVLNTPLPFAYQVHLRMSVWYVLFLKVLAWGTLSKHTYFSRLYLLFLPVCYTFFSFLHVFSLYRSCLVPIIGSFWICDHPRNCLYRLPTPWFPWNWSTNVSCSHSGAYVKFF